MQGNTLPVDMEESTRRQYIYDRGGPWAIVSLGIVAAIAAVGLLIAHPEPLELWALDFAVAVGFPGLLILMGYWLGGDDLPPEARWKIAAPTVGGFLLTAVLGLVVSITQKFEGGIIFDTGYVLVTMATFGAFLGMLGSMTFLRRRNTSPLQALGFKHREVDAILDEVDTALTDTQVEGWLAAAVIDERDLLRLRILQFLHEQDKSVPTDAVVRALQIDATLPVDLDRKRLQVELHHNYLPGLADAGLITYDPEAQIARADHD